MVRVAGERPVHKALGLVVAVLSIALARGCRRRFRPPFRRRRGPTISVLSGRADLVSGGDALISIRGLRSSRGLSVQAGGKDQTSAFEHGPRRDAGRPGPRPSARQELGDRACRAPRREAARHQPSDRRARSSRVRSYSRGSVRRRRSTRSATSRRRSATSTSRRTRRSRASCPMTRPTRRRTSRRRRPIRA